MTYIVALPSSSGYEYTNISSNTTAEVGKHYSCTGTFTLTLPSGASAGEEIRVKNVGTGTVTIDGNSTETIDGQETIVLDVQYSAVVLNATGNTPAAWEII